MYTDCYTVDLIIEKQNATNKALQWKGSTWVGTSEYTLVNVKTYV